jgi:tyrosyl-tRNA synthetase
MLKTMNIIDELTWRDAINQQSDADGLRKLTEEKSISLYCGFDPTGDSLHIGHLIPAMMLKRFALAGHHPFVVVGGGTGSIGDPSGRKTERQLLSKEQLQYNFEHLAAQFTKLLGQDTTITFVNNYDWLSQISLLDFLRDYGKHFSVNSMLAKDVVASRLESGISFTEFSYQILQAIDFYTLYKEHGVQLQIGGGDQWGNVTAGLDLIHKLEGQDAKVFCLTIPLMLRADGTKFGKTADGQSVWLDPEKTSPYEFYQFWLNQDDRVVVRYLKFFTFLSQEEIADLAQQVETAPEKRAAQRKLAEEVTRFVHGDEALLEAQKITDVLFSGDIRALNAGEVEQAFGQAPSVEINAAPVNIIEMLVSAGIEPSNRQARQDVSNRAVRINGEVVSDVEAIIDPSDPSNLAAAFDGKFVVIRKGKKNYFLAKVV